jgi:hypothetical protein
MGVQVVGRLPLNQLLYDVPDTSARSMGRKALIMNAIEKITWVALISITAAIFTVSYSGLVLTGYLPLVLVGCALSTPILAIGASRLNLLASSYANKTAIEKSVENELKAISHWKEPEIRQFFEDHQLRINRVPVEPLRQKIEREEVAKQAEHDSQWKNVIRRFLENHGICVAPAAVEPPRQIDAFTALLPAIARFKYMHQLHIDIERKSKALLDQQYVCDTPIKRNIRRESRNFAHIKHEFEALPKALEAAFLLHIIENPTLQGELKDVGEFRMKAFDAREQDRQYPPVDDDYFVFNQNVNRPALKLRTDIEANMSPSALRFKLFPRALQA